MKTLMRQVIQSAAGRVGLAAVLMAVGSIQQSVATPEYHSLSGVACQPANLGQAQNLGAKWTETNFVNPNPIGSGTSFFAVCPVQYGENTNFSGAGQGSGGHDVYVFVERPAGASDVTCTVRRFDQTDFVTATRTLVKTVSDSASGATGEGVRIILNDIVDSVDQQDVVLPTISLCSVACRRVPA